MSGSRINTYSPSTGVLDNVIGVVDYSLAGGIAITLTNYTSTILPRIQAGSIVEVAGDIFEFSTENTISTTGIASTASCDYYIKLVPSSSECSAEFSTIVPTWRTDHQGYYENSTSDHRYIGKTFFDGSGYIQKYLFYGKDIMKPIFCYGILSTTTTIPSTLTVPMSGYIKTILDIKYNIGTTSTASGAITYLSSYTINSTSVVVKILSTSASTVDHAIYVYIHGVDD